MLSRFCCLRLNAVGILIGWFGMTMALITIVVAILGLIHMPELTEFVQQRMENLDICTESLRRSLYVIINAYLVVNLVHLVASALLVVGTMNSRHLLLLPWLLNSGFSLCISIVYYVYYVQIVNSCLAIASSGLSICIQFCMWYIIYSLFLELREARQKKIFQFTTEYVCNYEYP